MQSWNASDGCRFDGHEKIEIVTVAIRLTLESREARGADGGVVAVLSYRSLSGGMHEAARVHRGFRQRGGVAGGDARAAALGGSAALAFSFRVCWAGNEND